MPQLPAFDFVGLGQFFGLMTASLAVMWGAHKAIEIAKYRQVFPADVQKGFTMKKFFIFFFLLSSLLKASMLLDKSYPVCIEDFYIKGGALYYLRSNGNSWASTTSNNLVNQIHYGYTWDDANKKCVPDPVTVLGMDYKDFNFLLGLIGVLFGFTILWFSILSFVNLGRKL